MSYVVISGPDPHGVGDHLSANGADVSRIEGRASQSVLERAGIDKADVFIITDPTDGTSIPIAKELSPSTRIVVYAEERVPQFARHQADLLLDPSLVGLELLTDEVIDRS